MEQLIHFEQITDLFRNARDEGRDFLFEHETYRLLSLSGSETPPDTIFLKNGVHYADQELMAIPGEQTEPQWSPRLSTSN